MVKRSTDTVQKGLDYHQKGNLEQAEAWYQKALKANPKNTEVLRLLGILASQKGNYEQGIDYFSRCIQLGYKSAILYFNLGNTYRDQGNIPKAINAYETSLQIDPQLGVSSMQLAMLYQNQNQTEKALFYYQETIKNNPSAYDAYNNLGLIYQEQKEYEKALDCYQKTISIKPDIPEAHNNLGNVYQKQEKWELAINCYEKALELRPTYPEANNNLAAVYQEKEELDLATIYYQKAIEYRPNYVEAIHNLGMLQKKKGNVELALSYYNQVLTLNPNYPEVYNNLGIIAQEQKQWEQAINYYRKTLALNPNNFEAQSNLGLLLLLTGNLIEGWEKSESRFELKNYIANKPQTKMWDGRPLNGKSLLVWNEQGLGDAIQFSRYLLLAQERGARIILRVHHFLVPLFQDCFKIPIQVINKADYSIADYPADEQISIMSLPRVFQTTMETIPAPIPYIFPPKELRQKCLIPPDKRYKIGIVWASHIKNPMYAKKTCSINHFMGLLDIDNVSLYSLQVGVDAEQINPWLTTGRVYDYSDKLKDYVDTITLVSQLDLIISVDTSVAHLAGAMGKPVWMILPWIADWRWFLDRADTPWYPSMRLFRQSLEGDWESVFMAIGEKLRGVVKGKTPLFSVDEKVGFLGKVKQKLSQVFQKSGESRSSDSPMTTDLVLRENQTVSPLTINESISEEARQSLLETALKHHREGKLDVAKSCYEKLLDNNPEDTTVLRLLGVLYGKLKEFALAEEYLNRVFSVSLASTNSQSDLGDAYNNLGGVYRDWKKLPEAEKAYQKSLQHNPNSYDTYNNLGLLYQDMGRFQEAITAYRKAIALNPDSALAHTNLGLLYLLLGNYKEGLPEVEYRFQAKILGLFNPNTPPWDGQADLEGKTIAVWNEQGIGDTIQFIRYIYLLKQRGATVTIVTHHLLVPLFRQCLAEEFEVLVEQKADIYSYDYHVSGMSLPYLFNTTISTIPNFTYLFARYPLHSQCILPPSNKLRIGIVWASKRETSLYEKKTCPISLFMELLSLGEGEFYSLQVGEDAKAIQPYLSHPNLFDFSENLTNFAHTASLIAQLDLIITVDTAVAHLAGAMGKTTWILLNSIPDWRWLLEREDTPWYSSVRLFRQPSAEDWRSVIDSVKRQLQILLNTSDSVISSNVDHVEFKYPVGMKALTQKPLPSADALDSQIREGMLFHHQGKIMEAKTVYESILQHYPHHPEVLRLLGMISAYEKNYSQAISLFTRSIEQNPNNFLTYYNLGNLYKQQGNLDQALQSYHKSIAVNPTHFESYNQLGGIFQSLKQWDKAKEYYEKTLQYNDKAYDAYNNLGMVYFELREYPLALNCYQKALELQPTIPEIYNNLGNVYHQQKEWELAIDCYEKAISLRSDYHEAHNNLGTVYHETTRYEQAKLYLQKAIDLRPDYAEAYNNMGMVDREIGNITQAIQYHQKALQLDPNSNEAHGNIALVLMLAGYFQRGFLESEWRFDSKEYKWAKPKTPMWDGSDLQGKTIIIWNEQGIGDALQFVRYAKLIQEKGGNVVFRVNSLLVELFNNCLYVKVEAVSHKEVDIYDYPAHASIMSLPRIFNTTFETIPAETPYFFPPNPPKENGLILPNDYYKIGIVWASNKGTKIYQKKSCPIDLFMELLDYQQVALYSIQVSEDSPQINPWLEHPRVFDYSQKLKDFTDTATLIDQLDLIITVDTAVAHLAGGMGKPTWVVLPYVGDWRWFEERQDSPWYPSIRLFRQPQRNDWKGAFALVREKLGQVMTGDSPLFPVTPSPSLPRQPLKEILDNSPLLSSKGSTNELTYSPLNLDTLLQQGMTAHQQGNSHQAETIYQTILQQNPDHPEALRLLGLIYHNQKQDDQTALTLLQKSLDNNPHSALTYFNIGNVYKNQRNYAQAITAYQKSQEINPNYPLIYEQLGLIYQDRRQYSLAIETYERGLSLDKNSASLYNNLGMVYQATKQYNQALNCYKNALKIKPNIAEIHNNLGNVYQELYEWNNAINCYKKAIELNPDYPEAYNNLGVLSQEKLEIFSALEYYKIAINKNAQYYSAYYNLGLILLLLGDFLQAGKKCEYRFDTEQFISAKPLIPMWRGEELDNKSIVLWNEQGIGDSLQFIRFGRLLQERGAKVIFALNPSLDKLLKTCLTESYEIIDEAQFQPLLKNQELWEKSVYDYHCSLMSLPYLLGITLNNIPSSIPYILPPQNTPNSCQLDQLGGDHPSLENCLKVGIVWGSKKHTSMYRKKSCNVSYFVQLLDVTDKIILYSLQVGDDAKDIIPYLDNPRIKDLSGVLEDFTHTASVIAQLDLIITVDTAVAHLAGAMGKPTWILLPFCPDWRWLLNRHDSLWYPTVRLFRQTTIDAWEDLLTQVMSRLNDCLLEVSSHCYITPETFLFSVSELSPEKEKDYQYYLKQGHEHYQQGNLEKAIESYREAITLNQESVEAYNNLGVIYESQKRYQESIDCYHQVIHLNPYLPQPYNNLGLLYFNQQQWEKAWENYNKALLLKPNYFSAQQNLGSLYLHQRQYHLALETFQKAISLNLESAISYACLAWVYDEMGKLELSLEYALKALDLNPNYAEAHTQLASLYLLQGNFQQGWKAFRWRFQQTNSTYPQFTFPSWTGESLVGKSILLWDRLGYGDVIQFSRYVAILQEKGAIVTLSIPLPLYSLMANSFRKYCRVILPKHETEGRYDYHCDLMSLPLYLETTLETIPNTTPYLIPDDTGKILPPSQGYKVGFVYACANSTNFLRGYHKRSCSVELFLALLSVSPALTLYSLQVGEDSQHLTPYLNERVIDLSPEITDFNDTAQFIQQLDLIITIDTSVAHLAGAMGKPTWILLPFVPDWRWLLNRNDSPWYPSVTLFRQPSLDDWETVFTEVKTALGKMIPVSASQGNTGDENAIVTELTLGMTAHQQGNLSEAEMRYRSILAQFPHHSEALRLLGMIVAQKGNSQEGINLIQQSLQENPDQSLAYYNLGNIYKSLNNYAQAITYYQTAIAQKPDLSLCYGALGSLYQQMGDWDHAISNYEIFLQDNPNAFDAYNNLGMVYQEVKNHEKAITCYENALKINPNIAEIYNNMGNAYRQQQENTTAIGYYQKALELRSNYPEAHNNLGATYYEEKDYEKAIKYLETAIALQEKYIEAYQNLALVYNSQENYEKSAYYYERIIFLDEKNYLAYHYLSQVYAHQKKWELALETCLKCRDLNPEFANNYTTLGFIYQEYGQVLQKRDYYEKSIECYHKVIEMNPNQEKLPYHNLGVAYQEIYQFDIALDYFYKTLEIEPNSCLAKGNIGLVKLLLGEYKTGLEYCESRFEKEQYISYAPKTPMWNGVDDLSGKTIVMWNEQGVGDAIHFGRYAKLLKAKGAEVTLAIHPLIVPLFRESYHEKIHVVNERDCDIYSYDYHISILSLTHVFNHDLETIPAEIPYFLPPNPPRQRGLILPTNNLKIGIVWASHSNTKIYQKKSATVELFMELLDIEGVELYSLQVGSDADKITPWKNNPRIHDFGDKLQDFADTATLISQLDLVVSVDTAVAHLAAGMGKPTYLLLSFVPDWRWLLEREDSPWYPQVMKLYRQKAIGDWSEPFEQIKKDIIKLISLSSD